MSVYPPRIESLNECEFFRTYVCHVCGPVAYLSLTNGHSSYSDIPETKPPSSDNDNIPNMPQHWELNTNVPSTNI